MKNEVKRLHQIIKVIRSYHLLKDFSPENLRKAIEALGPTFIKIGQIASAREDLFPEEYTKELSKLRSQVKPMRFSIVKNLIESEYHQKWDSVFASIDKEPLGSASIAQVHKATLLSGETVAVKIQRENIEEAMCLDIKLLKKAISILNVQKFLGDIIDLNDVLDEMYETAKKEMNFKIEAENMIRFSQNQKDILYIETPKVYEKLSTSRILVMQYVTGLEIYRKQELIDLGYQLDEIALKLADNYLKQALEDGFFHADPHADNIKIDQGKIIYLDFGMMGILSKNDREILVDCMKSIISGDIEGVEHALLLLSVSSSSIDYMRLRKDLQLILERHQKKEIKDIDIKQFFYQLLSLLADNHIKLSRDITMLIRGIIVLEGTLEDLYPEISLMQVFRNHVKNLPMVSENTVTELAKEGLKSSTSFLSLPNEMLHLIKGINRGEMRFNIEINDSKHQMDKMEGIVEEFIITILDVAFIVGTSLIVMNNKDNLPFIFYLYMTGSVLCTVWLLYKMILRKFKRK